MGCQRKHIVQEIKEIAKENPVCIAAKGRESAWVGYQPEKKAKESKNSRVSPFLGSFSLFLHSWRNKLKQYEFRWRTPLGVINLTCAKRDYINK